MPIGVVSDDDLEAELDRLSGKRVEIREQPSPGRKEGDVNVPTPLKKVIGETAIEDRSSALALAEQFDVSPSSVSAYKKGATSTASYDEPHPELAPHISQKKDKVAKKARRTLMAAMRHITDSKLESAKPRDLAGIAKDMSAIVRNMEPENQGDDNSVKFVFVAPQIRKEESFEVIDVES